MSFIAILLALLGPAIGEVIKELIKSLLDKIRSKPLGQRRALMHELATHCRDCVKVSRISGQPRLVSSEDDILTRLKAFEAKVDAA